MSGQSYSLTELRSLLLPVSQLVVWPIFFLLTIAISQQPAYFLALFLVLASDVFNSSPRKRGLLRDSIAGGTTILLSLFLNDQEGFAIGAVVAFVAVFRLLQKRS